MDARQLTEYLGGKWYGGRGNAPCPICQVEGRRNQNALSIADGKTGNLALFCHKSQCAFLDVLAAVGLSSGDYSPPDPGVVMLREMEATRDAERRAEQAKLCWVESTESSGTLVESYLKSRGILCNPPEALRFNGELWHGPTAKRYPGMVAAVTRLDGPSDPAIHRTYLRGDGLGKAPVEPARLMLGSAAGGCILLSEGAGSLVVAEGIESALSFKQRLEAPARVVAALSAPGMAGLAFPAEAGDMLIAVDGDKAGREAADTLGRRAVREGWRVRLADPGDGLDWNDTIREIA